MVNDSARHVNGNKQNIIYVATQDRNLNVKYTK